MLRLARDMIRKRPEKIQIHFEKNNILFEVVHVRFKYIYNWFTHFQSLYYFLFVFFYIISFRPMAKPNEIQLLEDLLITWHFHSVKVVTDEISDSTKYFERSYSYTGTFHGDRKRLIRCGYTVSFNHFSFIHFSSNAMKRNLIEQKESHISNNY